MQGVARGDDEDAITGQDTDTSLAGEQGLEDMTDSQRHALATGPEIKIPGPHDPKWHEEFIAALRTQGIVPVSEREAASKTDDANEPEDDNAASAFAQSGDPNDIASVSDEDQRIMANQDAARKAEQDRKARERAGKADLEAAPFSARRDNDLRAELYSALWWATVA